MIRSGRYSGFDYRDVRCVVVEDEEFSRRAATRILRNLGCREVATAGDGVEALEFMLTSGNSFDVVLSDVEMPRMDGLQLLKTVRTGVRGVSRDIPFIMVTSHTEKHVVGAAFNLDVDFFIVKPVTAKGVKTRLNRLLATDRPVKEPIDYETIEIKAETILDKFKEVENGQNWITEISDMAIGRGSEFKDLVDLRDTDTLAQDLFAPSGQLLVSKGQKLSDRLIDRLRDLEELGVNFNQILVDATTL